MPMSTASFYARVYREDEVAELNWKNIATRIPPPREVVTEKPDNEGTLQNEYLVTLMEPGNHYSIRARGPAEDDDQGTAQAQDIHFRVLNMITSRNRAHMMRTVDTPDEVQSIASLAFEVVMETVEQEETIGEQEPTTRTVRFDHTPVWVRPQDLADFELFNKTLVTWMYAEPSSVDGRTALSIPERTRLRYAILDDRCPVLGIVQWLKNKGWRPHFGPVTHTTGAIADFDSTEATRQKRYLQVVSQISSCIALTSSIPSRQVIHFYDCLLRGIRVEPNRRSAEYAIVLNQKRLKDGKLPTVVPLEDGVVDAPPDPDEDRIVGPVKEPPQPKTKAAPRPVRASASRPTPASGSRDIVPRPHPREPGPAEPIAVCPRGGTHGPPEASSGESEPDPIMSGRGGAGEDNEPEDVVIGGGGPAPKRRRGDNVVPKASEVPGLIPGTVLHFQDYVVPGTGKAYPNFWMTCSHCTGPKQCYRTRGDLDKFRRMHGPIEPLAFLPAWEPLQATENKTHNKVDPNPRDVAAFAEANRDALADMRRRLCGS